MINNILFRTSPLILALVTTPFSAAQATAGETHHFAPIQSGVKVNKPVLSPIEQRFEAIRNDISALRKAKTARERNQLLNAQSANLDALQALIGGNAASAPAPAAANELTTQNRINRLERRVDRMQMMMEKMMRQRSWR